MPSYKVTLEDGRSYKIDADRKPTDEEAADAVFDYLKGQSSAGGSFARSFLPELIPSAGTAIGGVAGGTGGPVGAVAGGVAGGMAARDLQNEVLGEEGLEQLREQQAIDQAAHPYASKMGGFLGIVPAMFGGGGGAGKLVASEEALANLGRFAPQKLASQSLESATAFAGMQGSGAAQAKMEGTPGSENLSIPKELAKGFAMGGVVGFVPQARSILTSILGKAPADATVMAITNELWNAAKEGRPVDPGAVVHQTAEDAPGFALLNAFMGRLHGMPFLPPKEIQTKGTTPENQLTEPQARELEAIAPTAPEVEEPVAPVNTTLPPDAVVSKPPVASVAGEPPAPPVEPTVEPPVAPVEPPKTPQEAAGQQGVVMGADAAKDFADLDMPGVAALVEQTTQKNAEELSEPVEPAVEPPAQEPAALVLETPPVDEAPEASIPLMITRDMRQQLADLGYSSKEMDAMTPQQANDVIARQATAPESEPAPKVETESPFEIVPPEVHAEDVHGLTKWALDNTTNEGERAILEKVQANLDRQAKAGTEFPITWHEGSVPFEEGLTVGGLVVPRSKQTTLDFSKQHASRETVFHELIHAATVRAAKQDPELWALVRAVRDHIKTLPEEQRKFWEQHGAAKNPDELLAYGMSHPETQRILSEIKIGDKSAWTKFVDWVRGKLGLSKDYTSALDEVLRVGEQHLEGTRELTPKQIAEAQKAQLGETIAKLPPRPSDLARQKAEIEEARRQFHANKALAQTEVEGGNRFAAVRPGTEYARGGIPLEAATNAKHEIEREYGLTPGTVVVHKDAEAMRNYGRMHSGEQRVHDYFDRLADSMGDSRAAVYTEHGIIHTIAANMKRLPGQSAKEAAYQWMSHELFHKGKDLIKAAHPELWKEYEGLVKQIPEFELDAIADLYSLKDWRTNDAQRALAEEEWVAAQIKEGSKLPPDSLGGKFVAWLKKLWQKITGKTDPTDTELMRFWGRVREAIRTNEREFNERQAESRKRSGAEILAPDEVNARRSFKRLVEGMGKGAGAEVKELSDGDRLYTIDRDTDGKLTLSVSPNLHEAFEEMSPVDQDAFIARMRGQLAASNAIDEAAKTAAYTAISSSYRQNDPAAKAAIKAALHALHGEELSAKDRGEILRKITLALRRSTSKPSDVEARKVFNALLYEAANLHANGTMSEWKLSGEETNQLKEFARKAAKGDYGNSLKEAFGKIEDSIRKIEEETSGQLQGMRIAKDREAREIQRLHDEDEAKSMRLAQLEQAEQAGELPPEQVHELSRLRKWRSRLQALAVGSAMVLPGEADFSSLREVSQERKDLYASIFADMLAWDRDVRTSPFPSKPAGPLDWRSLTEPGEWQRGLRPEIRDGVKDHMRELLKNPFETPEALDERIDDMIERRRGHDYPELRRYAQTSRAPLKGTTRDPEAGHEGEKHRPGISGTGGTTYDEWQTNAEKFFEDNPREVEQVFGGPSETAKARQSASKLYNHVTDFLADVTGSDTAGDGRLPPVTPENTKEIRKVVNKMIGNQSYGHEFVNMLARTQLDAGDAFPTYEAGGVMLQSALMQYAVRNFHKTGDFSLVRLTHDMANHVRVGTFASLGAAGRILQARKWVMNQEGFEDTYRQIQASKAEAAAKTAKGKEKAANLEASQNSRDVRREVEERIAQEAETPSGQRAASAILEAPAEELAKQQEEHTVAQGWKKGVEPEIASQQSALTKDLKGQVARLEELQAKLPKEPKGKKRYAATEGGDMSVEEIRTEIKKVQAELRDSLRKLDALEDATGNKARVNVKDIKDATRGDEEAQRLVDRLKARREKGAQQRTKSAIQEAYEAQAKKPEPLDAFTEKMRKLGVSDKLASRVFDEAHETHKANAARKLARDEAREKRINSDEYKTAKATAVTKDIIDSIDKSQTEWLNTEKKENEIRKLANEAVKDINPGMDRDTFVKTYLPQFEALKVPPADARTLLDRLYRKSQTLSATQTDRIFRQVERSSLDKGIIAAQFRLAKSQQQDPAMRRQVAIDAAKEWGLTDSQAKAYVDWIGSRLERHWTEANVKAFRKAAEGLDLNKATLASVEKAIRSYLDPAQVAGAEPTGVLEALAEASGFRKLSPEKWRELAALDEKMQSPSPHERLLAISKMERILEHAQIPKSMREILVKSWTNSALSSTSTFGQNATAPVFGMISRLGVANAGLLADVATGKLTMGQAAGLMKHTVSNFFEAYKRFVDEFKVSARNDAFASKQVRELSNIGNLHKSFSDAMETLRDPNAKPLAKAKAAMTATWSSTDMVRRILSAMDQAHNTVIQRFLTHEVAMRELVSKAGMSVKEAATLMHEADMIGQKVYAEKVGEYKPDEARLIAHDASNQFIRDTLEEYVPGAGEKLLKHTTLEADYELGNWKGEKGHWFDLPNFLAETVKGAAQASRKDWPLLGRMLTGFVAVPANLLNRSFAFTPVGLARILAHSMDAKRLEPRKLYTESLGTDYSVRQRMIEGVAGTIGLTILGALLASKDKDGAGFDITGAGPQGKGERDAWAKQGHHIGAIEYRGSDGKVIAALPWARGGFESWKIPALLLGTLNDMKLNGKLHSEKDAEWAGAYMQTALQSLKQQAQFFGLRNSAAAAAPMTEQNLASNVTYSSAPLVPFSGLLKSLGRAISGPQDQSSLRSAVMAQLPAVAPFSGDRALNGLGDPIGQEPQDLLTKASDRAWFAGLPLYVAVDPDSKDAMLYSVLTKRGMAPDPPSRRALESKNGIISDSLWKDYVIRRGQFIKQSLRRSMRDLQTLPSEEAEHLLSKVAADATKQAKQAMRLH